MIDLWDNKQRSKKAIFPCGKGVKMNNSQEPKTQTMAETDNYLAWKAEEADGENTYHLELNNVTLHFFTEEWQEFLDLARILVRDADKM